MKVEGLMRDWVGRGLCELMDQLKILNLWMDGFIDEWVGEWMD